jgi:glycosyltransferase involved in cell wall biosynthesis
MRTVKYTDVRELHDHNLDIIHTYRSGDDFWHSLGFDNQKWKGKIVESSIHGYEETKADLRVAPSPELKQKMKGSNVVVIPNAIQPKLTEENLREKLGIGNKFVFGKIARPSMDIFSPIPMEAYAQVQGEDTAFIYVGDHGAIRELADKLKLINFIVLPQTIDDVEVSRIYNTFDIMCHGNKLGETFGNTIAEAMVHAKPVVSHRGANYWPQAHYGVMGNMSTFICEQDPALYAKNMMLFKDDVYYYQFFARYGQHMAQEYDYRVVANKYLEAYAKL